MYILFLSWVFLTGAGGTYENTEVVTAQFENKAACMFAGKQSLETIKARDMKAMCVPAKI